MRISSIVVGSDATGSAGVVVPPGSVDDGVGSVGDGVGDGVGAGAGDGIGIGAIFSVLMACIAGS